MNEKKSKIDALLDQDHWNGERKRLRQILLGRGLVEDVKWGKLCYTFEGDNVAMIYGLKNTCAVGFFKGSLLADEEGVLVAPGKHSRAMRQMRFSSLEEIERGENILARTIDRAIQAEKDGLEADFAEKDTLSHPDELRDAFRDDPELAQAFHNLTPGRQRGYLIHFCDARQSKTRASRILKCRRGILDGKGLRER